MAALISSNREPAIWSHETSDIDIHGGVDVRMHDDVIVKTKISRIDGLPYFLDHGAP